MSFKCQWCILLFVLQGDLQATCVQKRSRSSPDAENLGLLSQALATKVSKDIIDCVLSLCAQDFSLIMHYLSFVFNVFCCALFNKIYNLILLILYNIVFEIKINIISWGTLPHLKSCSPKGTFLALRCRENESEFNQLLITMNYGPLPS